MPDSLWVIALFATYIVLRVGCLLEWRIRATSSLDAKRPKTNRLMKLNDPRRNRTEPAFHSPGSK
jgi:hypothetical protein